MVSPDLSFVIPVYNEERVLAATFAELIPFLEGLERTFEVVCVDDGSRDGSAAILDREAAADPRIRVEHLSPNQGKGGAVRTGMLMAEGDFVFFLDADLSTPLDETPAFLSALETGCDVVIGNRRSPGSHIERRQPWIRETLGKGFTKLTQTLLAPGVYDFTCGFKGFRRDAAQSVFERSTLDKWAFDAELVVIAHQQGLRLAQLPVRWRHEDDTKVRVVAAVFGTLVELVQIFANKVRGRYR